MAVRRNTWQRSTVRTLLDATPGFVSAQALHLSLSERGDHIGLATVYRALNELAEAGEIDLLRSSTGESLYRACQPGHHHHLICRECGRTEEIHAEAVEQWARGVAEAHGFVRPRHVVDVFGTCADCARSGGEEGR